MLKYNQRRYKCKECGKTFNEPCNLADSSSTIANSLKLKVLDQCKQKKSYKDISKDSNINEPIQEKCGCFLEKTPTKLFILKPQNHKSFYRTIKSQDSIEPRLLVQI